jgi:hypothetical protein
MKKRAHQRPLGSALLILCALLGRTTNASAELPSLVDISIAPGRSLCESNDECLSHEYCAPTRVCTACAAPIARCSNDTECGSSCAGTRCIEGRCVRASTIVDRDVVSFDGSGDATEDGGRSLRSEGPRPPGCGARVGPANDQSDWVACAVLAAGAALALATRRRRDA